MKQQESNFKYFVSIMLTLIGLITSGLGGLGVYLKDNSYSLFLLLHGKQLQNTSILYQHSAL